MKKVKLIRTEDFYPTMVEWWKARDFVEVSPSILPQRTFVVYDSDSGTELYSVCFYTTDSFLVWIGWPIGNPAASKEEKEGAFKFLFDEVERYAKECGFHVLFTTTDTPPVRKILEQCNYKIGDENVTHYLKVIT